MKKPKKPNLFTDPEPDGPKWAGNLKACYALMSKPREWVEEGLQVSGARRANGTVHLPTLRIWISANFDRLNDEYEARHPGRSPSA